MQLFRALLFLFVIVAPCATQATVEHKRVLIMFQGESTLEAQRIVEKALRSTLNDESTVPVEVYAEYLDSARTDIDSYENELVNLLKKRYAAKHFDLIFAVTHTPLQLLLKHRNELFPDTPIVYLTHDRRNISNLDLPSDVTGVWGEISFKPNLDQALALHPGTKKVVVISGVSEWDKYWLGQAKEDFRAYESQLEFTYLIGHTTGELKDELAHLPPNTVVFFITNVLDNAGNTYENIDVLREISPAASAPIYGTTDAQLGNGIVGGTVLSFQALGEDAAHLGLRILAGENPSAMSPHLVPGLSMYDWRQLQRWGISEASLPKDSVIQFKQPTVWEDYGWWLTLLLAAIALQSTFIGLLIYSRHRTQKAESENAALHKQLVETVSNVPGIVWESRLDPETGQRKTTFISDYVEKMLGYSQEEWLTKEPGFGFSLVAEEERERVKKESEDVVKTGKGRLSEFRWRTKDGKFRWVENYLVPIFGTDGKISGLRGVAMDITDRKLAEETARSTQQKNEAILAAIPDLMFLQTVDGDYLDYHATDPTALLLPPELFLGKNVRDILPSDLAEQFLACFRRTAEGEGPQVLEYELEISGKGKWYEARMVRSGDRILSMVRDITERVQALDALIRSEERFSTAFRANPQPMTISSFSDGRFVEVNQSFLDFTGYSREEVIGHNSVDIGMWVSPDHRSEFIEKAKDTGRIVNYESVIRTKQGEHRTVLLYAERLSFSGRDCLMISTIDITERHKAQQALQESEARFRNMADTAPVMIWVSGTDKLCTYFNKEWVEFRGRSIEEEFGNGWVDGVHPDDRSECFEIYSSSFDHRQAFEMEYRLLRHDGEYRWIVERGTPRFSSAGEFLGYIGSCVDNTERKESAEALSRANEELKELKNQLEAENIYLHQELQQDQAFGDIVGHSSAIKYVLFKINQVAATDATVLITGETGTGKELVARAIHESSSRSERPLIKVNCAALTPSLIESELFGHEKGSFTGAVGRKIGRFELANHGTLMLDEIGELPLDLQAKLLRVLQEGELERVGSGVTINVDVRIIAMTNRDLKEEVKKGKFREDLWYRLNVFPITTPPLRERPDDIPVLTDHFTSLLSRKFGKNITAVAPDTMKALCDYSWPGNVRELANVIERAVINAQGPVLRVRDDLTLNDVKGDTNSFKTLEETEREYIQKVLQIQNWRIDGPRGAAIVLGINPSTLRTRMAKLGINKPNVKHADVPS